MLVTGANDQLTNSQKKLVSNLRNHNVLHKYPVFDHSGQFLLNKEELLKNQPFTPKVVTHTQRASLANEGKLNKQ